ncbi:hypothetical protein [Actinoplanes aureus]|uniref:DUF4878 domain-containing protein n=1 Tax=Actinoplanes aureus TaxID=2792083 RepID=A0A931G4U8_9ACTN|nr:hypothetical protein [Actinoplanes aureus]MBG0565634.1 hypothetical protein [Actinoplanes aureus]
MSSAPYAPPPFDGSVPPPPPGPGVHPPFPAPPVEGKGRRIGLGFGIGGGVLLLVCGGGAAALFGVFSAADDALNEQATVVVSRYVDAVQKRDFDKAYRQLCQDTKDDVSQSEYTAELSASEPIQSYQIGDFNALTWNVPVRVTYTDGDVGDLRARIQQNTSTGAFEVCELGE